MGVQDKALDQDEFITTKEIDKVIDNASKEAITNGLLYDRNETQTILERLATQNL